MASDAEMTPQAKHEQLQNLQYKAHAIATKIAELEIDAGEHDRVVRTITPLDPSRKCFRLIGGVLVEKTVKDVLPEVAEQLERLDAALKTLRAELSKVQKETESLAVR